LIPNQTSPSHKGTLLTNRVRNAQDLQQLVDSAKAISLDLPSAKKMVLKFEKTLLLNQKLRSKFFNEPTKFLESEADLDTEIKQVSLFSFLF
jgi:hypothetical protein